MQNLLSQITVIVILERCFRLQITRGVSVYRHDVAYTASLGGDSTRMQFRLRFDILARRTRDKLADHWLGVLVLTAVCLFPQQEVCEVCCIVRSREIRW
jgi:hypothetical protein